MCTWHTVVCEYVCGVCFYDVWEWVHDTHLEKVRDSSLELILSLHGECREGTQDHQAYGVNTVCHLSSLPFCHCFFCEGPASPACEDTVREMNTCQCFRSSLS